MTTKQVVGWVLVASVLGLVACGSDDGDGGGGVGGSSGAGGGLQGQGSSPGETRTLADFCKPDHDAELEWCSYHAKCCTPDDQKAIEFYAVGCFNPAAVPSVASCVAGYEESIAKGEFGFDGRYVDACLKDLAPITFRPPSTCSGPGVREALAAARASEVKTVTQSAACRAMLPGTKKESDPCKFDSSCAYPLACKSIGDKFFCGEAGREGSPCDLLTSECALGLRCVDRVCRGPQSSGGRCEGDGDCDSGLVCSRTGTTGLCRKPLPIGATCDLSAQDCEPQLWCDGKACRTRAPAGASCADNVCQGRCDQKTKVCLDICGGDR